MSSEIAIRVNQLSKCYHVYAAPYDRLKQFVLPSLDKLLGAEPRNYYDEFWALNDVSFEIKKGEVVGIIGRNGSGKSTLLQLICGTLSPTNGSVQTHGRIAALLELGSGFNPEFSGRENVYLNAAILGLSKEDTDRKYDEILAFADIGEFIDQPVKTYSSGMAVRLAFAVASCVDPDILIVDEALAVGDIRFQLKCQRKFEEFRGQGKTILVVSHSGADIVRLCDRAVWLNDGRMRAEGEPQGVIEEYHAWMMHDTVLKVTSAVCVDGVGSNLGRGSDSLAAMPSNATMTGEGGASIDAVGLFDDGGNLVRVLDRGQQVRVVFKVSVYERIESPFFGMQIINSKGLRVISNGNLVIGNYLRPIEAGTVVRVEFSFQFPEIENGEYLIALGVNDGTSENHIRHCYAYDAYEFQFISSSIIQKQAGLIKMKECAFRMTEWHER